MLSLGSSQGSSSALLQAGDISRQALERDGQKACRMLRFTEQMHGQR